MSMLLPQLPTDLQGATPPAQTVMGHVSMLRQRGQSDHAESLETLQQNIDSLGNYLFAVVNYLRALTQQTIGTYVSVMPVNSYTLTGTYADMPEAEITLPVPGLWLILAIADVRGAPPYVIQTRLSDGTTTQSEQILSGNNDMGIVPLWTFGFYNATTPSTVIKLQARYATVGSPSFIAGTSTPGNTILAAICVQQQIQQ